MQGMFLFTGFKAVKLIFVCSKVVLRTKTVMKVCKSDYHQGIRYYLHFYHVVNP